MKDFPPKIIFLVVGRALSINRERLVALLGVISKWSHVVMEKLMTKRVVVTLCARDSHDHNRTIEKTKISEANLLDLTPKAFN